MLSSSPIFERSQQELADFEMEQLLLDAANAFDQQHSHDQTLNSTLAPYLQQKHAKSPITPRLRASAHRQSGIAEHDTSVASTSAVAVNRNTANTLSAAAAATAATAARLIIAQGHQPTPELVAAVAARLAAAHQQQQQAGPTTALPRHPRRLKYNRARSAAGPSSSTGAAAAASAVDGSSSSSATDADCAVRSKSSCQVIGCQSELVAGSYGSKHRVCNQHRMASAVALNPTSPRSLFRFCNQCMKFEPVTAFDGLKKGCRVSLAKRRERDRARKAQAAASSSLATSVRTSTSISSAAPSTCGLQHHHHQQQHQQQQQQLVGCARSSATAAAVRVVTVAARGKPAAAAAGVFDLVRQAAVSSQQQQLGRGALPGLQMPSAVATASPTGKQQQQQQPSLTELIRYYAASPPAAAAAAAAAHVLTVPGWHEQLGSSSSWVTDSAQHTLCDHSTSSGSSSSSSENDGSSDGSDSENECDSLEIEISQEDLRKLLGQRDISKCRQTDSNKHYKQVSKQLAANLQIIMKQLGQNKRFRNSKQRSKQTLCAAVGMGPESFDEASREKRVKTLGQYSGDLGLDHVESADLQDARAAAAVFEQQQQQELTPTTSDTSRQVLAVGQHTTAGCIKPHAAAAAAESVQQQQQNAVERTPAAAAVLDPVAAIADDSDMCEAFFDDLDDWCNDQNLTGLSDLEVCSLTQLDSALQLDWEAHLSPEAHCNSATQLEPAAQLNSELGPQIGDSVTQGIAPQQQQQEQWGCGPSAAAPPTAAAAIPTVPWVPCNASAQALQQQQQGALSLAAMHTLREIGTCRVSNHHQQQQQQQGVAPTHTEPISNTSAASLAWQQQQQQQHYQLYQVWTSNHSAAAAAGPAANAAMHTGAAAAAGAAMDGGSLGIGSWEPDTAELQIQLQQLQYKVQQMQAFLLTMKQQPQQIANV